MGQVWLLFIICKISLVLFFLIHSLKSHSLIIVARYLKINSTNTQYSRISKSNEARKLKYQNYIVRTVIEVCNTYFDVTEEVESLKFKKDLIKKLISMLSSKKDT